MCKIDKGKIIAGLTVTAVCADPKKAKLQKGRRIGLFKKKRENNEETGTVTS